MVGYASGNGVLRVYDTLFKIVCFKHKQPKRKPGAELSYFLTAGFCARTHTSKSSNRGTELSEWHIGDNVEIVVNQHR